MAELDPETAKTEEAADSVQLRRNRPRFPPRHRLDCSCSRCEFVRAEVAYEAAHPEIVCRQEAPRPAPTDSDIRLTVLEESTPELPEEDFTFSDFGELEEEGVGIENQKGYINGCPISWRANPPFGLKVLGPDKYGAFPEELKILAWISWLFLEGVQLRHIINYARVRDVRAPRSGRPIAEIRVAFTLEQLLGRRRAPWLVYPDARKEWQRQLDRFGKRIVPNLFRLPSRIKPAGFRYMERASWHSVTPEEALMAHEETLLAKAAVPRALERLPPRSCQILKDRFGFASELPKRLDEIGQVWGITRERIRQVEQATLKQLRRDPQLRFDLDIGPEPIIKAPMSDYREPETPPYFRNEQALRAWQKTHSKPLKFTDEFVQERVAAWSAAQVERAQIEREIERTSADEREIARRRKQFLVALDESNLSTQDKNLLFRQWTNSLYHPRAIASPSRVRSRNERQKHRRGPSRGPSPDDQITTLEAYIARMAAAPSPPIRALKFWTRFLEHLTTKQRR